MTDMIDCKNCTSMAGRSWFSGPYGVEEERISCDWCGYFYEFYYGYHIEGVPNKPTMTWNYIDSEPVVFTGFKKG